MKIARAAADQVGVEDALGNLANAFARSGDARLGETRVAIECHSEQLQIAREIGDRHTEGCALWNTSLALDKLGDRLQAITHAEAARRVFDHTKDAESARVQKQLAEWTSGEKRKT